MLDRRQAARPVFETGGEAAGALVEGLFDQSPHPLQFLRVWRPQRVAEHGALHGAVADEGGDVDAQRHRLQPVQVVAEAAPAESDAVVDVADAGLPDIGIAGDRRATEAALADDLRGHALVDLAFGTAVDQQGEVGMGVQIDEAGGDGQAA